MTKQQTFWKALHSLSNPISIAAILLLLFNDHWLRYNYPSWLTGKLGDFTWLIFAPFIAAMLFAWLIPTHHSKFVGLLSFGFIGFWFATAKTILFVHYITTETLYALVGWRGTLRMDASDLLTLPALLIGWWIWQQASHEKINLKPVAYVAFGLGILGTMATSPPEIMTISGVVEICSIEDALAVRTSVEDYYSSYLYENLLYMSKDGGFTWEKIINQNSIQNIDCQQIDVQNKLITPNAQFRWFDNQRIEISYDEGQTWKRDYNLIEARQDVRIFYAKKFENDGQRFIVREDLPINAIYDPISKNVLFAMGWNGILLRTPDGSYQWVSVDEYRLQDLSLKIESDNLFGSLRYSLAPIEQQGYFMLALSALVLITLLAILAPDENIMSPLIAIMGWAGWLFLTLLVSPIRLSVPSVVNFNLYLLVILGTVSLGLILGIPVILIALVELLKRYRLAIVPLLITILLANTGYIFPYLLWLQGTIPRYLTATVFSLLLTGTVLYACYVYFKPKLPERYEPEKTKRKNEEVS